MNLRGLSDLARDTLGRVSGSSDNQACTPELGILDELFHPAVATWFAQRFGAPSEPQARGWPVIAAGRDTLIAAPTGSGKTLAAFLACLDRLIRDGLAHGLRDATQILYISPLKALSNDVHRNLERPLEEIRATAARMGLGLPEIRAAVRTGDTPAAERGKMARKPPHILVTTPESLFILLTSDSGRTALSGVHTVIVDEIHALARDKRGAHLTLSLERLDRLTQARTGRQPVRVGLSATQRPIELIGRMLTGTRRPEPFIIDGGHARKLDIAIEMTDDELGAVASHQQMGRVYDRIAELCNQHSTTLVFVNTRRLVERVAHQLEQRLGEEQVVAHHGSMARELRFAAEQKLKAGTVRCAVATASLELGIDVGDVDLVIQLGSPRSIATLLQRIGRSGHSLRGTPKGRLFALTRDQLVECAALVRAIRAGSLDAVEPRMGPLDILAQHLVAMVASEGEGLGEDELYELCRCAFHYAELGRSDFDSVVHMLSEGISDRRGRATAHLHRDRVNGRLKARRGARLAAVTSGGAIPENANYQVVLYPDETRVGELDEHFAVDSSAGDIFLLGNTSWRIRRIEAGKVIVEDAGGAPPNVPFWAGEAPGRTIELSEEVGRLRRDIEQRIEQGESQSAIAAWVHDETAMPRPLAGQLVAYLAASRAVLGALPTRTRIIAERFFDEAGGMQLVIHSPLGGRINRAWGLALRKRFCRSFNFELQAAATDDGIVISLGQPHSFPLEEVFRFLSSHTVEHILIQALLDSPMFEVRWRWNVTRSLMLLRRTGGKKVAPHLLRMRAADLLSVVFPQAQACLETIVGDRQVPDHPLVHETVQDCLIEAMDIARLRELIQGIENGAIEIRGRDTVEPSPLSHELLSANPYAFLDDAPAEERRTRAVTLRRGLPDIGQEVAALDMQAAAAAEDEASPVVRDADELHDALLTLYLLPEPMAERLGQRAGGWRAWQAWFSQLVATGRATRFCYRAGSAGQATQATMMTAWVAAERLPLCQAAFANATTEPVLPPLPFHVDVPAPEAVDIKIMSAQLDCSGPRTGRALARDLGMPAERVLAALYALENDGAILRGVFFGPRDVQEPLDIEWCNRRILARIHRLTMARLRSEVEPVSAAALMRFLFQWQRVAPGTQISGAEGLHTVIEQLQGFESAAGAWEREILPARLHRYDPAWLDTLCLSGQVAWCRLSPRKRASDSESAENGSNGSSTDITDIADIHDIHDDSHDSRPANSNGQSGKRATRSTPTKAAPLAVMLRADLEWLRAPASLRTGDDSSESPADLGVGEVAREVHAYLARAGASFLAEIVTGTGRHPSDIEDGLWELVAAGLATADGFACLRVLVDRQRGESRSVFDMLGRERPAAPPSSRTWMEAVRKARQRERYRPAHAVRSLPTAAGRWSLLVAPRPEAMNAEASARQLLGRYGVVFRDLLAREPCLPPWRELLIALRRLEARGEIRGGRFVTGVPGEQFALPEAVDGLRAMRAVPAIAELVRVPATDPLNLVGITSPGPRVPAVIGNAVLYRNGVPLAALEAGEVVLRQELDSGARVDSELVYHPPPRREPPASAQASLPFA